MSAVTKTTPPSPFAMEAAMSALMSGAQRLLHEDPSLADDEALFTQMLACEAGDDVFAVMERLVRAALHAESMEEAAKNRATDLAGRAKRYGNRGDQIRGMLLAAMEALDKKKWELADATVTRTMGKKFAYITDEAAIPDEFWKITKTPMKAEINAALTFGVEVPGTVLANGAPGLTIRKV